MVFFKRATGIWILKKEKGGNGFPNGVFMMNKPISAYCTKRRRMMMMNRSISQLVSLYLVLGFSSLACHCIYNLGYLRKAHVNWAGKRTATATILDIPCNGHY